jgi:hypothetical protein
VEWSLVEPRHSQRRVSVANPLQFGQSERVSVAVCAHCGRPTEEHNRHLRFVLPEPVLEVPAEDRAARTWGNEVLMMVEEIGAFVRVLCRSISPAVTP